MSTSGGGRRHIHVHVCVRVDRYNSWQNSLYERFRWKEGLKTWETTPVVEMKMSAVSCQTIQDRVFLGLNHH